MADTDLTTLPDAIQIGAGQTPRFTPNQMRALRAETGKTMEEILGDEADGEDRMQAIVWLELRRLGYSATWEEAGDVAIEPVDETPDPMNGSPSPTSPSSAGSGA